MSTLTPRIAVLCVLSCAVAAGVVAACQTAVTEAVVINDLPADAAEPLTVYKVWYRSTLYLDPVAPGQQSEALRVGAGAEVAYALIAPAYDPDGGAPYLVPARTKSVVRTEPGDSTRLVFSTTTAFIGCGDAGGLSREDYDAITMQIFPRDKVRPFDPAGCSSRAILGRADGGSDRDAMAGSDGPVDGG